MARYWSTAFPPFVPSLGEDRENITVPNAKLLTGVAAVLEPNQLLKPRRLLSSFPLGRKSWRLEQRMVLNQKRRQALLGKPCSSGPYIVLDAVQSWVGVRALEGDEAPVGFYFPRLLSPTLNLHGGAATFNLLVRGDTTSLARPSTYTSIPSAQGSVEGRVLALSGVGLATPTGWDTAYC